MKNYFLDIHPDYSEKYDVFIDSNGKQKFFPMIKFKEYGYCQTIMALGSRGILTGRALSKYLKLKEQFARVIKEFKQYDMFCNKDDTLGVIVHEQKNDIVSYYLHKVPNGKEGKFWNYPATELSKKRIGAFAMAVLKLNPERYRDLISTDLLVL